jgi:hypothetical protein
MKHKKDEHLCETSGIRRSKFFARLNVYQATTKGKIVPRKSKIDIEARKDKLKKINRQGLKDFADDVELFWIERCSADQQAIDSIER